MDLKDAYSHIMIPPNISDLPVQGTSIWPLYSTQGVKKDLAPVVLLLRSWGIQIQAYLDWIFHARSSLQAQAHAQRTLQLSKVLGWMVNWDKCLLVPSQQVDFLGLHFNQ